MIDPGWLGFVVLLTAPLFQLRKLLKTGTGRDVAIGTYLAVELGVICYFIHALIINDLIFTISNGVSILMNGVILVLLVKGKQ